MNDVRRLEIKIANLKKQKKQRKAWTIVVVLLVVALIVSQSTINQLNNQINCTAYAKEAPEKGQVLELSEQERELVQRVVAAEARGESFKGQMAVAQVIRDRCLLKNLPVEDVIYAKDQFAELYEGEISSTTEAAVGFVFEGGHNIFDIPVTHFYAHDLIEAPDWTEELVYVEEIGGHSFYTEAKYATS